MHVLGNLVGIVAFEEFLVHANNVLVQLDRLSEAMQKFSSIKAKKNIRIGTFETNIGQHKTVNLFQQFQAAYPDVNASIAEKSGSTELIKLLKSGSIDAAFMVPSPELYTDSTFTCHPLIPGTVHVIFRKDHPLATQKTAAPHTILPPRQPIESHLDTRSKDTLCYIRQLSCRSMK